GCSKNVPGRFRDLVPLCKLYLERRYPTRISELQVERHVETASESRPDARAVLPYRRRCPPACVCAGRANPRRRTSIARGDLFFRIQGPPGPCRELLQMPRHLEAERGVAA